MIQKLKGHGQGRREPPPMPPKREQVEMVDGRIYFSTDNWATVYLAKPDGKARLVTGDEAKRARLFAVYSH